MSASKEISATYTRSKKTMQRYIDAFKKRKETGISHNPFEHAKEAPQERFIKEFEHWFILDNEFPYDAVADTNHMIATKRTVVFDWDQLTQEELDELHHLKKTYLSENYDVVYENLPSGQTQPGYFHLHLLKLRRSSMEEFMNS